MYIEPKTEFSYDDREDGQSGPTFLSTAYADVFRQSTICGMNGEVPDAAAFLRSELLKTVTTDAVAKREAAIGCLIRSIRRLKQDTLLIAQFAKSEDSVNDDIVQHAMRLIDGFNELIKGNGTELAAKLGFKDRSDDVMGVLHDCKPAIRSVRGYLECIFVDGERSPDIIDRLTNSANDLSTIILLFEQVLLPEASSSLRSDLVTDIFHGAVTQMIDARNALLVSCKQERCQQLQPIRTKVLPAGLTKLINPTAPVYANRFNLPRVFRILTANAIDSGAFEVKIYIEDCGDTVKFTVANDGKPIPDHHVDLLFHTHFSAPTPGVPQYFGGWGDGLSTARRLVSQMGGEFDPPVSCWEKADGGLGGAAFSFRLKKVGPQNDSM